MGPITRKQLRKMNMDQAEKDRRGPRRRLIREGHTYTPKSGDTPADAEARLSAEQKRARRALRNLALDGCVVPSSAFEAIA